MVAVVDLGCGLCIKIDYSREWEGERSKGKVGDGGLVCRLFDRLPFPASLCSAKKKPKPKKRNKSIS